MRLTEIKDKLEAALNVTGYVNSIVEGDPYDQWNNDPATKYVAACYAWELTRSSSSDNTDTYEFVVYVADKLTEAEDNVTTAQDFCNVVFDAALRTLTADDDVLSAAISGDRRAFVQKFADNLAGVYATLDIEVPKPTNIC